MVTHTGSLYSKQQLNIVDLLCTFPSGKSFDDRVKHLQLPREFEEKVIECHTRAAGTTNPAHLNISLTREEEVILAGKVLFYRHQFTTSLLKTQLFRQAAITVIQNIYLFRNRHIFFEPPEKNTEAERTLALNLFSGACQYDLKRPLPIELSLRHPPLARIWSRILHTAKESDLHGEPFKNLHGSVESLNTLRNIYMMFSSRLIMKLAGKVNPVYKQSVSYEDRVQIGFFGIARAAYRYHPSCGTRFSTYAGRWFFKEVQRQALNSRLIHLSVNKVEQYAQSQRTGTTGPDLSDALLALDQDVGELPANHDDRNHLLDPEQKSEQKDEIDRMLSILESKLPKRSEDVIRRRYGLQPYSTPQSIIDIAKSYNVTRGRIYQIEEEAYTTLRKALSMADTCLI